MSLCLLSFVYHFSWNTFWGKKGGLTLQIHFQNARKIEQSIKSMPPCSVYSWNHSNACIHSKNLIYTVHNLLSNVQFFGLRHKFMDRMWHQWSTDFIVLIHETTAIYLSKVDNISEVDARTYVGLVQYIQAHVLQCVLFKILICCPQFKCIRPI